MEYVEYLEVAWDYLQICWVYSPWMAYFLAFVTLVPKVWKRTVSRAETELQTVKFHRCYGATRCCHPLEESDDIVRPRKKVLRRIPPPLKRNSISTDIEDKFESTIHSSQTSASTAAPLLPTQPNHVNQIAKMFEGNVRKVNRVMPIVTNEHNSGLQQKPPPQQQREQPDESAMTKKLVTDDLKYEKMTLRNLEERYFKPSPPAAPPASTIKPSSYLTGKQENIPENDENSGDVLNRPLEKSTSNIVVHRRRYPSTSPSPPPPKQLSSRPNSLMASIENIFALAGKATLTPTGGPVTSIEEILSQRRLSRPLSAYSISDLLGDSVPDDSYIESVFGNLNK